MIQAIVTWKTVQPSTRNDLFMTVDARDNSVTVTFSHVLQGLRLMHPILPREKGGSLTETSPESGSRGAYWEIDP